jgi:HNH endonuclease
LSHPSLGGFLFLLCSRRTTALHDATRREKHRPCLCHKTKPTLETKTVNPKTSHKLTKTEIITTIKRLAKKLGRVPTNNEVEGMTALRRRNLRKYFSNFSTALRACGMENPHSGVTVPTAKLFEDWARVARTLKKLPTTKAYRKLGRHSMEAVMRVCGQWSAVPRKMQEYAHKQGLEKKWKDVMKMVDERCDNDWPTNGLTWPIPAKKRWLFKKDRPVYGPLMSPSAMMHVPTNEAGVLFLFAAMALELGYMATIVRTGFPDCEALREISPGRLQRVQIEFEYLSRNFLKHRHRVDKCDIIVCWINNWPECPLEVIELSKLFGNRKRQRLTTD